MHGGVLSLTRSTQHTTSVRRQVTVVPCKSRSGRCFEADAGYKLTLESTANSSSCLAPEVSLQLSRCTCDDQPSYLSVALVPSPPNTR